MTVENLIFSQLLTNDSYSRAVLHHLKEEYFSTTEEKNFLKVYARFYKKHNKIPSKQAMLIEIEKLKSSAEVYTGIKDIIERTVPFEESDKWLIAETESYCRDKALFNALRESVLIVDGQTKGKSTDSIPTILQNALSICFDTKVGHDYMNGGEERYEHYHLAEAKIPTGIPEFDLITKGGLPRKTLNLFLAPPHGGKSLVMSNVGAGALMAGYNVLTITLEMSDMSFAMRYDVQLMDVDFDTLSVIPKNVFMSKLNKIREKSMGRMVIEEFPTGVGHVGHFRALLEELKTKQNFVPDLIIVDYVGICASENYKASSGANSYTIMKSIGEELRALAITHNCAILSAIQTNRSGVGASDITMQNIAESLGSAMTADFILALIVTDELKDMNQMMFQQIKNRYGGIIKMDKFLMGVDYNKMKLYSLEQSTPIKLEEPKKIKKTSPKEVDSSKPYDFDILHTISTESASFDDFKFE